MPVDQAVAEGGREVVAPGLDEHEVGVEALDEVLDRPVAARLDQPGGDLAQQPLVVAPQRLPQVIGPGGGVGERHVPFLSTEY